MASTTYRGSFGANYAGTYGRVESATGTPIPQGMKITSIDYTLDMSAGGHSRELVWIVHWFALDSEDGSPYAPYKETVMNDDDQTITGSMNFTADDIEKFRGGSITVYAKANTTHSSQSTMGDFTITVNYTEDTKHCVEPESVLVNGKSETVFATGDRLTLAWSGAQAGTANSIRGYRICSYDSTDGGNTWDNFQTICEVETSATIASTTVDAPAIGTQRKFLVYTLSAVSEEYDSPGAAESPVVVGGHPALEGFTDPVLIAGTTMVKALHMQELQDRVTTMRQYYGLGRYDFSAIVSGETSLGSWTRHVNEIRAAIDEIGLQHETWLTIPENKPRVDVMMQLREVILGEPTGPIEPPTVDTTSELGKAVLGTMKLA